MKLTKNNFFRAARKTQKAISGFFVKLKYLGRRKKKEAELNHLDLNRELVYSLSTKKLPNAEQLKHLGKFLTNKEKKIVRICALILAANLLFLGIVFFNKHVVSVPLAGGSYIEGVVGSPKYVNPLYSSNHDVDADITSLVFSSLFKYDQNGILAGDLADSWSKSTDGREYTINLKKNVTWHNGEKLNADDVVFTVQAIKDPRFRSPLRGYFSGVEIEKVDDYTVKFRLGQPFAPFLSLLNFGILPKNIWQAVSPEAATLAELNLKPIGSGPYKFKSLTKDQDGNIKDYVLEANKDYYGQKPLVAEISFNFYPDVITLSKALNDNSVDGVSYLPISARKDLFAKSSLSFHYLNQPQLEAIFFNQKNNEFLADKNIRQALDEAIDRQAIIQDVFNGQAREARGPILSDSPAFDSDLKAVNFSAAQAAQALADAGFVKVVVTDEDLKDPTKEIIAGVPASDFTEKANDAGVDAPGTWLVKKGTKKDPDNKFLVIALTYPDSADNALVAGEIQAYWQAIGVKTSLNPLPSSQIISEVAVEKNFEALLFGENIGADPDVYAFWDSSQISEGLNIASYNNPDADKLLEAARVSTDNEDRFGKYRQFQKLVTDDEGAIFLFSPNYLYLQVKKLQGFSGTAIIEPSDRFSSVSNWYLRVSHHFVW